MLSTENLYTISWFDFSMNPFFIKDIDTLPKQNWQTGSIALNLQICFINIKTALHHHCKVNLDRSFVLDLVKLILNFFSRSPTLLLISSVCPSSNIKTLLLRFLECLEKVIHDQVPLRSITYYIFIAYMLYVNCVSC